LYTDGYKKSILWIVDKEASNKKDAPLPKELLYIHTTKRTKEKVYFFFKKREV
jgi:hypothetical protein